MAAERPVITIVGLGPGDKSHLTARASEVLAQSHEIWVRTTRHPSIHCLPPQAVVRSCDDLYDALPTFDAVYEAIAERLVAAAGHAPVVYAVPGDPCVGEATVDRLRRAARERGWPIEVVPGVSFLTPVLAALEWDALDGLQVADATILAARHHPDIDPDRRALVAQLHGQLLAGDVKLALLNQYPPDHPVTLVVGAGTAQPRRTSLPLAELDRVSEYDDLTTLAVPPLGRPGSLQSLAEVVARLRAPDGCPWDREQTHQSLRPYLLEEAYEVLSAIEAENDAALAEELGDLLLQVVLHAQLAAEAGVFRLADVIAAITQKIIRRHPHVFGAVTAETAEEVLGRWDAAKLAEGRKAGKDPFADIPATLPALARAQLVQRKGQAAERWDGLADPRLSESLAAMPDDADERTKRIGAALWVVAAIARAWQVDAEMALRDETENWLTAMRRQATEKEGEDDEDQDHPRSGGARFARPADSGGAGPLGRRCCGPGHGAMRQVHRKGGSA